jgi:Flp pilus assembly protein TadG
MSDAKAKSADERGGRSSSLMRRIVRRLRRDSKGSTAVEFAMIAPLFLGALVAIMETGTLYLRLTALETGVEEAKRVTLTGQVANAGAAPAQLSAFKTAFCDQVSWLIPCDDVKFDVRAFTTFGVAAMPSPVTNGVFNPANMQFDPGKPCQIVVIRAYYELASITALVRNDVSKLTNGKVLLVGSAAFKNEPYGAC